MDDRAPDDVTACAGGSGSYRLEGYRSANMGAGSDARAFLLPSAAPQPPHARPRTLPSRGHDPIALAEERRRPSHPARHRGGDPSAPTRPAQLTLRAPPRTTPHGTPAASSRSDHSAAGRVAQPLARPPATTRARLREPSGVGRQLRIGAERRRARARARTLATARRSRRRRSSAGPPRRRAGTGTRFGVRVAPPLRGRGRRRACSARRSRAPPRRSPRARRAVARRRRCVRAPDERGEDRDRRVLAGDDVDERDAVLHRRTVRLHR